jgi:hypothetical protein
MLVVVCGCAGLWLAVDYPTNFHPFCRVEHSTRPNPSADFAPILWQELMLTHKDQGRLTGLSAVIKMGGGAVGLGHCYLGRNYQYFKTLFFRNDTVP